MEVQFYVDHRVAGATLEHPKPYSATVPSHWATTHEGRVVWPRVGEATPPHAYKLLGLLSRPLHQLQEIFCLCTKSWGQVDIFP